MTGHSHSADGEQAEVREQVTPKTWHQGLITARALQSKQFKPLRIILPNLIPEGLTLLAGKPKVGKSWLALDVCLAVADESRFVLGDTRPVHGNALYLALEDNERRLHWRIKKIVQGQPKWPDWLDLRTEWRRVDEGGLEDIEAWCETVKQPRLIWIDTLPKIRSLGLKGREQAYAADYRAMEGLQALAGRRQLGIVVNAHLRKAASEDDPIDDINGTLGLSGAADTAIVLKRHSGMVKIYLRGRDIEEAELAAEFNRETCRWRIVGGAEEAFRSQERRAIIDALKEAGEGEDGRLKPLSVSQIMAAVDRTDRHAVDTLLYKMRKAGEIEIAGRGLYSLRGNPLNSGVIGEIDAPQAPLGAEAIYNATVSAADQSHHQSHHNHTGAEGGVIAGVIAEPSKPLANNGNSTQSHHHTDHTGIEYGHEPIATVPSDDFGPIPVPKHRCNHCGSATGITKWWKWPGWPDGIWLHERCEEGWRDSHKPALGSASVPATDVEKPARPPLDADAVPAVPDQEPPAQPDQPVSAPVISTPDPANDRGERGLSSRRVQEHARWYSDAAYWSYSQKALAAGALDAELRAILRKEVSLEHVEIEFERVKAVPR